MKVAAAQISCKPGDLNANIAKIRDFASLAKTAAPNSSFSQKWSTPATPCRSFGGTQLPGNEGAIPALQKLAKRLSLSIICGVSERDCASIYNSQAFIDANGTVIAKYRKTHLVSAAPIEERDCFTPGNEFSCFNFAGMRLGLSICYDLRFPEMCRTLAVDHR